LFSIAFVFLILTPLVFLACDWENKADVEAIEAERSFSISSPLDSFELDFTPVGIKACCWYNSNPATLLIDGSLGNTYWDWGWSGTASSNGSDFFTDNLINTNNQVGHTTGHSNALSTAAHFFTVDLGEKKDNIWRIGFYGRENAGVTDNRIPATYEVWISDDPIGINPESDGATKAAAGEWPGTTPEGVWRYADFSTDILSGKLVSARYIQLRSLSDPNGGTFEFAGREFKVDMLGNFDGATDFTSLQAAYAKGVQALALTEAPGVKYQLENLLYGEAGEDGEPALIEPGAKQLCDGIVDPETATLAEKIEFQRTCDNKAKALYALLATISLGK
jgi:hypothetical protein